MQNNLLDTLNKFFNFYEAHSSVKALIVFVGFLCLAYFMHYFINKIGKNSRLNDHIASLLARSAKLILIIFGCISALGTLGMDVTALVASLGLTGFALGFALKDTVANLLAGILILLYRPLDIGDNIKVAGYEGRVTSIDLRYTSLKNSDQRILIPNSKLLTDPICILGD